MWNTSKVPDARPYSSSYRLSTMTDFHSNISNGVIVNNVLVDFALQTKHTFIRKFEGSSLRLAVMISWSSFLPSSSACVTVDNISFEIRCTEKLKKKNSIQFSSSFRIDVEGSSFTSLKTFSYLSSTVIDLLLLNLSISMITNVLAS